MPTPEISAGPPYPDVMRAHPVRFEFAQGVGGLVAVVVAGGGVVSPAGEVGGADREASGRWPGRGGGCRSGPGRRPRRRSRRARSAAAHTPWTVSCMVSRAVACSSRGRLRVPGARPDLMPWRGMLCLPRSHRPVADGELTDSKVAVIAVGGSTARVWTRVATAAPGASPSARAGARGAVGWPPGGPSAARSAASCPWPGSKDSRWGVHISSPTRPCLPAS
jgi:hypothetical protein